MSRILVTGGSGFFGSWLVETLEDRAHDVYTFRSSEADLAAEPEPMLLILERYRPRVIIHSAAYYGGIGINYRDPVGLFCKNLRMLLGLMDAIGLYLTRHDDGLDLLVSIGSSCAYPDLGEHMKETEMWNGRCHESVEAYGFTKRCQQVGFAALSKQFGVPHTQLSLSNLYGEGDEFGEDRGHALAALVKKFCDAAPGERVKCWGDGTPRREFLYVGDAAEAVACLTECALQDPDFPNLVNVGNGEAVSIAALAQTLSAMCGNREYDWDTSKPRGVDAKSVDNTRMMGYLPDFKFTSFEEGLKRTVKWYIANKK